MFTRSEPFYNTRFPASFLEEIIKHSRELTLQEAIEAEIEVDPNLYGADGDPIEHIVGITNYVSQMMIGDSTSTLRFSKSKDFLAQLESSTFDSYTMRTGTNGSRPAGDDFYVNVEYRYGSTYVEVAHPDKDVVARFIKYFADESSSFRLPQPEEPPARVFIGHGGDNKWQVLNEALKDAGYEVETFESTDRTGDATFNSVLQMIRSSRVAVIVMTAADTLTDGKQQARPNVIHELGLAQGILGPENTIIVKEKSVYEFTNIRGINQLWPADGDLHSIKTELLAAVRNRITDSEDHS